MGLSTFIEIDNDFVSEIEKDRSVFVLQLLYAIQSGRIPEGRCVGVRRMAIFHRDSDECQMIQVLMKSPKQEEKPNH